MDHLPLYTRDVRYIRDVRHDWIESIGSNRSDRIDSTAEMDLWTNFKLFRPKLSLNRTINGQVIWPKHKKLFFSAPERARTVLNAFLECMYFVV